MEIQEAIEKLDKHKKWGFVDDTADAMELAIEALQKQMPEKPIDRCMFMECPTCHNVEIANCSYCADCGQKLDWGQDNGKSKP